MAILQVDPEADRCAANPNQFILDGWIATAPFEDLLDLRIEQVGQGRASLSMPFKVKHCQGGGLLHGGAMTALADTAVAMAIKSLLPNGTRFATTELNMMFLAPVHEGTVTAVAEVVRTDERCFSGLALVSDRNGNQVARFTSVFKLSRSQNAGVEQEAK